MDKAFRSKFESRYASWREKLLDLSARNRLLNFRATKVSTIKITAPNPLVLFKRLVQSERSMTFPLFEGTTQLERSFSEPHDTASPNWKVRPGELETSKFPPDLEKALRRVEQMARASLEERGVNTLYLALGLLEWRPQVASDVQLAPLLMVPVELTRENRLKPFVLTPFDEDAEINPTLVYMLRRDFEFAAPELDADPTEESLDSYFHKLERAVKGRSWRVIREAWLAQFQFKKLAMYRDLDDHSQVAANHSLVTLIAGCGEHSLPPEILPESEFDNLSPSKVFSVRDADSSQLAALIRARSGQDLIIQGPPGTGKSQTIANLIAQLLLDGRKILFVSEKMAALSVVYKRLKEAGLGPFCLEIHSDKANKRDVLSRIGRTKSIISKTPAQSQRKFDRLLHLRRELNEYVRALHTPVSLEQTAFDLQGGLATLADVPDIPAELALPVRVNDFETAGMGV